MNLSKTAYQHVTVTKNVMGHFEASQSEAYQPETYQSETVYQNETIGLYCFKNPEFVQAGEKIAQTISFFEKSWPWVLKFLPFGISWALIACSLFGIVAGASELDSIQNHISRIQELQKRLPGADSASKIAPLVLRLSKQYRVDAKLIVAIMALESGFVPTVVSHTHDYGLMQLNHTTGLRAGLTVPQMKAEPGLHTAMRTLLYMQRRYSSTESDWVCRYNIGTGRLTRKRVSICNKYARRVAFYQNM